MKRRGWIALFLTLVSVNFVSAAVYGSLSIGDALSAMDPSTMVLGVIFIIAALVINTGLSRAGPFRYNRMGSGIISISLALLIIWGINTFGWDYYSFFNGILFFIPEGLVETIWPILFLLFLGITFWKFGKHALLILGVFLIAGSFFAYESGILFFLGIALIVIWLLWLWKGKKKRSDLGGNYIPPEAPAQGPTGDRGPPGQRGSQGPPGSSAPPNAPSSSSSGPGFFNKWRGKTKQAGGWFGGKTKQGAGWAKEKWKQKQYAKAQGAAMKEDAAREKAKQQATKEQAHEEALRENAARDQAKQQKIEQKQQVQQQKQIETQQAQEQRTQEKQKKAETNIEKLEKRAGKTS